MLKEVVLALNNLEPDTWTRHEVEDIRKFIKEQLPVWPVGGRIYHGTVSDVNDVTPHNSKDVEALAELQGPFYVMVFPEAPIVWIGIAILVGVAAFVLLPPTPAISAARNANSQQGSANNDLSERTNRARINGRIPDIYGTVRSTPDLIAAPYKIFENNKEVEYAYMCVGRGPHDVEDIRDGDTLCENIPGTSIAVYGPYNSPNRFDPNLPDANPPQIVIGELVREPVLSAKRSNSINGQVLRPPNTSVFTGVGNVRFKYPNRVELPVDSVEDFTKFFVEGDQITIADAEMEEGVTSVFSEFDCRVTMVAVKQIKSLGSLGGPVVHTYNTAGGSLIFLADYDSLTNGLFVPGNSITLAGISGGLNLNGTYEVESIAVEGPVNNVEVTFKVPTILIVKLVNPETVNANWSSLSTNNALGKAPTAHFQVTFDASNSYDLNLDGTYDVLSVTKNIIILDNPSAVASDWNDVLNTELQTPFLSPIITSTEEGKWVGPYVLEDSELIDIYCNFVAANGLYKDSGTEQFANDVSVQLEVTPIDLDDAPLDDPEFFNITLKGSSILKETVALTMKAHPSSFNGRCAIRARRTTETDEDFEGSVVDEVRWRDAYSIAAVTKEDFGNVTTVFAVTFATASALAVKERKLNMLASRKIPTYDDGNFDDEDLQPTKDAALILAAICRDQYIGNKPNSQFDMENFISICDEIEDYFATEVCRQFCYTFDKEDLSFEETFSSVASAIFSVGYRRGSVIKLSFEKRTDDSTLLFNHRNKIPRSETRIVSFGQNQDNDGLQYSYVDPEDDSINTIFLPPETAAVNPKKVDSVGVRDHLHAYFHAWRIWNKIKYQYLISQFDACQESALLVINDRILNTDSTRSGSQDGEVIGIDGTELTLSQNVNLEDNPPYTIFLQLYDGSTQPIGCTAGSAPNKVVLAEAPSLPLVTDPDKSVRTGFVISANDDPRETAFLVSERSPPEKMVSTVKAYNYDERYYMNDPDFVDEVIDGGGYGGGGGYSPPPFGSPGYFAKPPITLTATPAENKVLLSWEVNESSMPGLVEYKVYNAAGAVLLATIPHVDGDTSYSFTVRALDVGSHSFYVTSTYGGGGGSHKNSNNANATTVFMTSMSLTAGQYNPSAVHYRGYQLSATSANGDMGNFTGGIGAHGKAKPFHGYGDYSHNFLNLQTSTEVSTGIITFMVFLGHETGHAPPSNYFSNINFVDRTGVTRTFASADATFDDTAGEFTQWIWDDVPNDFFTAGNVYTITFGH